MNRIATIFILAALSFPVSVAHARPVWQTAVPAAPVISGVVRDASGLIVAGASVSVRSAAGVERRTTTDTSGKFSVVSPAAGDITVTVRAAGFSEWRKPMVASGATAALEVQLEAAGVQEQVTVTPTRTE